MSNPLKSINIVGTLPKEKELSYKLCPDYFNLNEGVWEIALSDIAFNFSGHAFRESVYEISSNLVQGYYYPKQQSLSKFNVVLGRFDLDPHNLKLLQNFGSNRWFVVNHQPSEIILYFKEWPNDKPFIADPNFKVSVNLLLRRLL